MDRTITESLNSWFSASGFRADLARVLAVAPLAVIALVWLSGWLARRWADPRRHALLVVGLLAAGLALVVNVGLGHLYFRARPFLVLPVHPLLPRPADSSLYSDHLAVAGALTAVLTAVDRRLGLGAAAASVLLAVGRVGVGVQYPSDVLVGAAVGAVCFAVLLPARRPVARLLAALGGQPTPVHGGHRFAARHRRLSTAGLLLAVAALAYTGRAVQDQHWVAAARRAEGRLARPAQQAPPRDYHLATLAELAAGRVRGSHAAVLGDVTQVTGELDGDIHLRIEADGAFVVAEITPELPIPPPHIGEQITAWGIVRHDGLHNWWELHPLIGWHAGDVTGPANRSGTTGQD